MTFRGISLLFFLVLRLGAQSADDLVFLVGKDVSPPRVLSRVDPKYTREAREAEIQGTVIYELIVDKAGYPRDIRVLSPIGFGLDEMGEQAIRRWTFAPGMKDGMPVNIRAQVEIEFRFPGQAFNAKREAQRTAYNLAMHEIANQAKQQRTVDTIRRLADEKYIPAVYLLGSWTFHGENVAQDKAAGVELISRAAGKSFAPAVFELGLLYENGDRVPQDPERGMKMIREASMLGSVGAQVELGERYENGNRVDTDTERARYYFRLCAARGVSVCQFHLGRLLMAKPGAGYSDNVQAAAWLELAADSRFPEAAKLAGEVSAGLDEEQKARAKKLKAQLVRTDR